LKSLEIQSKDTEAVQVERKLNYNAQSSKVVTDGTREHLQSSNISRVKTQEGKRSTPGSNPRVLRKNNEIRSSGSVHSSGMYFGDKKSSLGSKNSKSPEARRVMEKLTHHRVKIDEKTQLLINGREVLTQKGIKGNIN